MATVRYLVADVPRAVAFYVDRLGFAIEQEMLPAFARIGATTCSLWLAGPSASAARPSRMARRPSPVAGIASSSRSTTSHRPWRPAAAVRPSGIDIVTVPAANRSSWTTSTATRSSCSRRGDERGVPVSGSAVGRRTPSVRNGEGAMLGGRRATFGVTRTPGVQAGGGGASGSSLRSPSVHGAEGGVSMTEPLMILVAGPYWSGTGGDPALIQANVDAMTRTALELYRRGHLPVMGEWFALPLIEAAEAEGEADAYDEIFHPIAERVLAAATRASGSAARPRAPTGWSRRRGASASRSSPSPGSPCERLPRGVPAVRRTALRRYRSATSSLDIRREAVRRSPVDRSKGSMGRAVSIDAAASASPR